MNYLGEKGWAKKICCTSGSFYAPVWKSDKLKNLVRCYQMRCDDPEGAIRPLKRSSGIVYYACIHTADFTQMEALESSITKRGVFP